jgi:prepilin-type N-terminal cleavage/methylation domain-containing protein
MLGVQKALGRTGANDTVTSVPTGVRMSRERNRGFTLIELLVVVMVLGVLADAWR